MDNLSIPPIVEKKDSLNHLNLSRGYACRNKEIIKFTQIVSTFKKKKVLLQYKTDRNGKAKGN